MIFPKYSQIMKRKMLILEKRIDIIMTFKLLLNEGFQRIEGGRLITPLSPSLDAYRYITHRPSNSANIVILF